MYKLILVVRVPPINYSILCAVVKIFKATLFTVIKVPQHPVNTVQMVHELDHFERGEVFTWFSIHFFKGSSCLCTLGRSSLPFLFSPAHTQAITTL